MYSRLIFLAAIAMIVVGAASSEMVRVPASQDIFFNLGSEQVFNKTDILRCEVDYTGANASEDGRYTGVPMIQFDISSLDMNEGDIGILVLKATSIENQGNDSAMLAMLPVSSEWNEQSEFVEFLMNFLPIWNVVKNNDLSQMGIGTDNDSIFAFDVSKELTDAKAKGGRISFLLLAISNSSYKVDFMSRETGQGPYLIVMPYPAEEMTPAEVMPVGEAMAGNTNTNTTETITAPENESLMLNQTMTASVDESATDIASLDEGAMGHS
jgi:hypothetical protein